MIIPFRLELDEDYNIVVKWVFRATKKGYYQVNLIYEPNKEEYIKTTCECWGYRTGIKREKNYQCKHIKQAIKRMQDYKQELNKGVLE